MAAGAPSPSDRARRAVGSMDGLTSVIALVRWKECLLEPCARRHAEARAPGGKEAGWVNKRARIFPGNSLQGSGFTRTCRTFFVGTV